MSARDDDDTVIVPPADDDPTSIVAPIADVPDDAPADVDADAAEDTAAEDDETVIVDAAEDDRTIIVSSTPVKQAMDRPQRRRRGELRPAPVPSGFGGIPLVAIGPWATTSYAPRTLPAPPTVADAAAASAPVRVTGGARSVAKRSRAFALGSLGAFAAAVVIACGGLVWLVATAFGA